LTADHGIDSSTIVGTGHHGRVRRDDVLSVARSAGSTSAATPRSAPVPMSRLRRAIATRAVKSMSAMAQLTTVVEVDVTHID